MKRHKIDPDRHEIFRGQSPEMLTYIQLMYDPDSTLVYEYQDLAQRRVQAAGRSGLNLEDEAVVRAMHLETEQMQELVHYYLTVIVASNQWSLLLTNQMVFNEYLEICQKPLDLNDDKIGQSKVKTTLLKDCNTLSKDIEALKREIFKDMEQEMAFADRKKRITVESMAMDMAKERRERRENEAGEQDMSQTETVGDDDD